MLWIITATAPITRESNNVVKSAQIPLTFPVQESMSVHDFMPTTCNAAAMAWVNKFPNWAYPALIVYGEKGCGKTHLLKIWEDIAGDRGAIIDDVDLTIFGDEDRENNLFHRFNSAKENGTFLFLSMAKPMAQQTVLLPDLQSRLSAAPSVEIQSPDDGTLQAIMVKMFHDRQLLIEPDVIAYILPRIERSFQAARDLVDRIDQTTLAEKRSVTVPLVRSILSETP